MNSIQKIRTFGGVSQVLSRFNQMVSDLESVITREKASIKANVAIIDDLGRMNSTSFDEIGKAANVIENIKALTGETK